SAVSSLEWTPKRSRASVRSSHACPTSINTLLLSVPKNPLSDLGIDFQFVICHPDFTNAVMATIEGISHADCERIENKVVEDINERATIYIFVQERMNFIHGPWHHIRWPYDREQQFHEGRWHDVEGTEEPLEA
ncbi:hypothetical protein PanWU01x14_102230, partial [Parasponia andersonii]